MHQLADAADAGRTVDYWISEGVTSFKAYNFLTAEELKTAIEHAHAHGLKITGHLCSVGFTQAADLGIDNLEHGLMVDTEFFPGKMPDQCPSQRQTQAYMEKTLDIEGPQVRAMIRDLVAHHVAITSTLAIFETFGPNRPPMDREEAALQTLSPQAAKEFLTTRARLAQRPPSDTLLKKEMLFEREFAAAAEAGVTTFASIFHACHRELVTFQPQVTFELVNFMELIGEAMGIHIPDLYKRLRLMGDLDQIIADTSDMIAAHQLDLDTVRDALAEDMFKGA